MNEHQLKLYPDTVLREHANHVNNVDSAIHDLIKGMSRIMYRNQGIGLAAPQVGLLQRVMIADIGEGLISLVNPDIIQQEGFENSEEGCLSLPEIHVDISRSQSISVKGINSAGNEIVLDLSGLMARVIQHEIDHLNGVLIIDYASTVEKYILSKHLDELKSQYQDH